MIVFSYRHLVILISQINKEKNNHFYTERIFCLFKPSWHCAIQINERRFLLILQLIIILLLIAKLGKELFNRMQTNFLCTMSIS